MSSFDLIRLKYFLSFLLSQLFVSVVFFIETFHADFPSLLADVRFFQGDDVLLTLYEVILSNELI